MIDITRLRRMTGSLFFVFTTALAGGGVDPAMAAAPAAQAAAAPYEGKVCLVANGNRDYYHKVDGMIVVDHEYATGNNNWHDGGKNLPLKASDRPGFDWAFTSTTGAVEYMKAAPGANSLSSYIIARGNSFTPSYSCQKKE